MTAWYNMPVQEHRDKFMALLSGYSSFSDGLGGQRRGKLFLDICPGNKLEVCPLAFAKAHCRGHTYFDEVIKL
jgi:hypothetical protein